MSYKSMTVCLDNSAGSSRRLDFALTLAAQHGAHLTGMHITNAPVIFYDPYVEWAPIMAEWEAASQKKQDQAKELFCSRAKKDGVNFDWVSYRSSDMQQVIAQARASDLTIIGQHDPADVETDFGNGFSENFVLHLGRPVLFLPHTGYLPKSFENIVVAWDGGREAARAMTDALPFLKLAQQVTVVTIYETVDAESDLPDIDIAAYLAKHDVKVEIERSEGIDMAPAEWLLSRSEFIGADLLVMGAYGHHRLTELVLGGMTRSVLRQMILPVLMSH